MLFIDRVGPNALEDLENLVSYTVSLGIIEALFDLNIVLHERMQ